MDRRRVLVMLVYLSLFLDNLLLTVVVPIIPDYLFALEQLPSNETTPVPETPREEQPGNKKQGNKEQSHGSLVQPANNDLSASGVKRGNNNHSRMSVEHGNKELSHRRVEQLGNQEKPAKNLGQPGTKEQLDKSVEQLNKEQSVRRVEQPMNKDQSTRSMVQPGTKEQGNATTGTTGNKVKATRQVAEEENGRVGALLASKALVQLLVNPVVGTLTAVLGYHVPLFIGSLHLLASALLFVFGEQYISLLLARSMQGVASAFIGVSGMCLVAELYTEEAPRSKVMGFVLGSVALGVLLGYPFGGFTYDFVGKMAPFIAIAALAAANCVLQVFLLDLNTRSTRPPSSVSWRPLLTDGVVVTVAGAILLSTSAMAILEPCLPIWLMDHLQPKKWQLGTVFVPDSVGYLVGTNFFGGIAYRYGCWRVAILALILVALSTILVPSASAVLQLAVPHFCLGLGIGVVDASLVPCLASLVDATQYGYVYSVQQTAVASAYFLGPLIGGEMVKVIGFPWLMRCVGFLNLLYCPLLAVIGRPKSLELASLTTHHVAYKSNEQVYQRFSDSD